jgi:hypothetical protein
MSLEVSKLHKHWKHVCVNVQLCVLPETVRKEAATVAAVFPSPDAVMAILVQVSVNTEHSLVFILWQAKD